LRVNLGFNKNKIEELASGISYIENAGLEGSIGFVRSYIGSAMGDYVSSKYMLVQNDDPSKPYYDASEQYVGRRVVNSEGQLWKRSEMRCPNSLAVLVQCLVTRIFRWTL
jgi:hypothetical protein